MEAKFGGKLHHFFGPVAPDLKAMGKKSVEWDLNDWKWDGDLFVAAPLNSVPSDCGNKQLFPTGSETPAYNGASNSFSSGSDGIERERTELEKRRRGEVETEQVNEECGSLNLKLGGQAYPVGEVDVDRSEGKSGKKTKISGVPSSRAVCQVEDCKADLSNAKDYHRRHKVCDVHSKATKALVGNVWQRFCQQCSRFHVLEEFDEGKRSCRRRLAGHNKRRRKTHPENVVNAATLNDERGSNYLLISLLKILSNIHSNGSDQKDNQGLLSHLLRNLANLAGTNDERNPATLLPVSQDLPIVDKYLENEKDPGRDVGQGVIAPASDLTPKRMLVGNSQGGITDDASALTKKANNSIKANAPDAPIERIRQFTIDLNNVYDDSQDCMDGLEDNVALENTRNVSPSSSFWLYKDSRNTQNSGNSGSSSSQSPSTSSGDEQSRTDRIVFKLFGKDPSDFPLVVRKQILDWLSNSPTEIESYIRPGCIILTIYLRMDNAMWEELYCDISSSLRRLLDSSNDSFWKTGWIYSRVQNHISFVYDGQVVLDTPSHLKNHQGCRISSISPIAVCASESVQFFVKGSNFSLVTSRLLCTIDGKYLAQENCGARTGSAESFMEHDEIQSLNFSCTIPNIVGRGFIEVEDQGLSSSFFPFIVAEKDVCLEICTLESIVGVTDGDTKKFEARNQALEFIHEMGWLLQRSRLKCRLGESSFNVGLFPLKRFRWLVEFSIDHDWCAVVEKLLSIFFDGTVDSGKHTSILLALLDMGLLHQAVRRNCKSMVEFLLEYRLSESFNKLGPKQNQAHDDDQYMFRPDSVGPGGLTPLHIAACLDGRENVLDALTEDPRSVGIDAWKNAKDSTGLTPHDYACFRGHYSYIHLVQRKLNKKLLNSHIVVDIPDNTVPAKQKIGNTSKLGKSGVAFETERAQSCSECERKMGSYGNWRSSVRIYKPAMLSMVAIAAVCVCAALLFKTSPVVHPCFRPFRWELLKYGSE
ncbi:squamosa promoter-binding-like protein 1-like [Dorcoceras hygrometricum]|uniref:Squamosa promoter-binding-like protein 1-like n=1 Tax=Dorcoceras hygrometricum TaxID=472368 RepID=A0A2Z7BH05_9LAMI|nr:squamosa promoter-binding-like protein 1-like [Dorcoceras hygrometricum]